MKQQFVAILERDVVLDGGKLLLYQRLHYFGIVLLLKMRRKSLVSWEVLTIGLCTQVACLLVLIGSMNLGHKVVRGHGGSNQ